MDWPLFTRYLRERRGTLIAEWLSEKGPVRWWWTPDDVASVSPYRFPKEGIEAVFDFDDNFGAACRWCHEKYTGDQGSALLVCSSYVPEMERRMESVEPAAAIPVVRVAAPARQRSAWAKRSTS
jgi:hypothetical protein